GRRREPGRPLPVAADRRAVGAGFDSDHDGHRDVHHPLLDQLLPGLGPGQHRRQGHQHGHHSHGDGRPGGQQPPGGSETGAIQSQCASPTLHAGCLLSLVSHGSGRRCAPRGGGNGGRTRDRVGQKSKSSSPESSSPEPALAEAVAFAFSLGLVLLPLPLRRVTSAVANRSAGPASSTFSSRVMRSLPSLSVNSFCWSLPMTNTRSPLPTDSAKFSPYSRHSEQRRNVGSPSTHSSDSLSKNRSLRAMVNDATAILFLVCRSSGSAVS